MFNVQFNIGPTRDAIRRAISELEDGTAMFSQIGEYMVRSTDERFAKRISPAGTAWVPKRPATLDRYKALHYRTALRQAQGKRAWGRFRFYTTRSRQIP